MVFESNATYFGRRAAEERAMMQRSATSIAREAHRQLADLYSATAKLDDASSGPIVAIVPARPEMRHLI